MEMDRIAVRKIQEQERTIVELKKKLDEREMTIRLQNAQLRERSYPIGLTL